MNIKDGLPNSNINCIVQDEPGFLWIGTSNGLCRYDGYSYELLPLENNRIGDEHITCLQLGDNNHLWISTLGGGLYCYDTKLERFYNIEFENSLEVENTEIIALEFQDDSTLWAGTINGLIKYNICEIEPEHIKVVLDGLLIPDPDISNRNNNYITCLKTNCSGEYLWVGTNSSLYLLDTESFKFKQIDTGPRKSVRTINQISEDQLIIGFWKAGMLLIDKSGNIKSTTISRFLDNTVGNFRVVSFLKENEKSYWVGTRENGVFNFTVSDDSIQKKNFRFNPSNIESLGSNSVSCILRDRSDIIWFGHLNAGGLSKITSERYLLDYIKETANLNVKSILARSPGKFWLGTQAHGLIYLDIQNKRTVALTESDSPRLNLGHNIIQKIFEDYNGNLWIGTHGGGVKIIPEKTVKEIETNTHTGGLDYIPVERSLFPVFNDYISDICVDYKGTYWIGSTQGLFNVRFDPANPKQISVNNYFHGYKSLKKLGVFSLYIDKSGYLWVCTKNKGIFRVDTNSHNPEKAINFMHAASGKESLQSNKIFNCRQHGDDKLWVTSSKGLDLIDLHDLSVHQLLTSKELGNNELLNLAIDRKGICWMGMNYGICSLDTLKHEHKRYYRAPTYGNYYNLNSMFQAEDGMLYMGTRNGITCFNPDSINKDAEADIPFYITSFKINNVKVKPGDKVNGRVILTENINETSEITLKSNDHHLSFDIASLDFLDNSSIEYKYILEGAAPKWTTLNRGQHTISYTNLRKGDYTLHIKASDSAGVWGSKEIRLNIKVLPTLWQSNTAIVLYSLLLLAMLYIFRAYSITREKEKNKLKLIQVEKEKSEELNNMKLQFFTNISHEFKTPLSLIVSPLEIILNKAKDPETKQQLNIIQRNANRLLFLINQILDIRKLEAGKIKLSCEAVNLSDFSSEIYSLFRSLAGKKGIDISLHIVSEEICVNIDRRYIESVLYNILSNAFRFTKSNDKIEIKAYKTDQYGCISVSDTGRGIPEDQLPRIFERFYHTPKEDTQWGGAGIGLSFSKSIVEMHDGIIEVLSEEGKGSEFIIKLPLWDHHTISEEESVAQISSSDIIHGLHSIIKKESEFPGESTLLSDETGKDLSILVVEDNSDLNEFISSQLKIKYNVCQAENGKIAWKLLQDKQPDLVITDLMMPEMDGMELCSLIKNSEDYSHIPVIMLTAKNLEEDRIKGYRTGADAYIFKPFKLQFLLLRVENLLAFKAKVKNQKSDNIYTPTDKKIESKDKIFIDKAIALIEENLNNSEFNVDIIYKSLGVSRTNLYRKIKELTGYSVKELVREIRLQNAAHILREDGMTVNEVAYSVGFESSSYFSRCFRKKFNMSPNEYKNEHYSAPVIEL